MTEQALTTEATMARLAELDPTLTRRVMPRRPSLEEELRDLADAADTLGARALEWDSYGEKGLVAELESRVADLLRTEAAAFFPSGVMAQQTALRVWCDRAGTARIAVPDLSHLLVHEQDGPRRLHGFDIDHLTSGSVTPTRQHLDALPGRLAAVVVELPLRDGGYLLPAWEELVDLAAACRDRGIRLHLDGARLWESAPHYGRSPAQIAGLADTTYVSFYKGLAGLAGAALAGPADVIAEARTWRRRHGGTLFTIAPFALAALRGLDRYLPRLGECHAHAGALARELTAYGFRVFPEPPHTTAFRLYAPHPSETMLARTLALAERDGLGLPTRWAPGRVPGWSFTEITVTPALLDAWPGADGAADAAALLGRLLVEQACR